MNPENDDGRREEDEACVQAMLLSQSFVFPAVFQVAMELNLFEIIAELAGADAYVSPSDIASHLPTQNPDAPSVIDRMLRLFVAHGVLSVRLRTLENGSIKRLYALTPACRFFLASDDGNCLASVFALSHHQASRKVYPRLKEAVLEGGDVFQRVHGMNVFEYMDKDPTLNKMFNEGMVGRSRIVMKKIVEMYKGFEGLSSLVDVGGGTGAILNMIISKYPSIRGINFDLPQVLRTAPTYPGVEHVEGSMFVRIPKADAIMLKDILHNWSDEDCLKILRNCYEALPRNGGKVIAIDLVMPEAPDTSKGSQIVTRLDNTMIMFPGGKERTGREFAALCKASGFSNFRLVYSAYGCLSSVMEFHK